MPCGNWSVSSWAGKAALARVVHWGLAVKFTGQILPTAKKVTYKITFKRVINRKLVMGIADGVVEVDGRPIYSATDLKVGLFKDTTAF